MLVVVAVVEVEVEVVDVVVAIVVVAAAVVVVVVVVVDPPNRSNLSSVSFPTEDIAVLATSCPSASSNGPAGETTALWDSLLFGVALGGFLNISPVSLELHPNAHSSTHNDVNS